ncbi:AAA family ATPase [bacterium]|nr:AAA family ATPase [bacterium]
MEKSDLPLFQIKEDQLKEYKEEITSYLKQVSWVPAQQQKSSEIDLTFLMNSGKALDINAEDQLSILKSAVRISDDRTLLSNGTIATLNAVRKGYCIGRHLAKLYGESSGLDLLQQKNNAGTLHQSELPEFHDKSQTQSAVLLYAAASYVLFILQDYKADETASIEIQFSGVPELNLSRPSKAIQCSLYYYGAYLDRSGVINTELHLLKITQLYFNQIVENIRFRKESFKYLDIFENNHYKLEKSSFVVKGFENTLQVNTKGITFNPTRMEDIVANKEAKHLFKRYAERLMCYDMEARKNPLNELGGLPSITMADGKPGTGKSMLIAATATLLKERCDHLGYNFLFWPLPENIVSTYQGGTAERAMEWFGPMQDTNKIVFAPIDDAENNLEERTRQGVSAGVREFIGVFLRNTEGAYAVNHGNRMISLFTNIPDQIDKAVLSRIQMRISMNGATSNHDFIDQDYLWWQKYEKIDDDFVKAVSPKGYDYMDAQRAASSLSEFKLDEYKFENDQVKSIFHEVTKLHDIKSQDFFGTFYATILKQYPFFSSRDLRNIQKAVDARVIDFDLPEIWWDKPDDFFFKPYEVKLNMLKELMKSNMGQVTFNDLRLYEALNYIENAIRINETGIEREIKEQAKRIYIQQRASKLAAEGKIHD